MSESQFRAAHLALLAVMTVAVTGYLVSSALTQRKTQRMSEALHDELRLRAAQQYPEG